MNTLFATAVENFHGYKNSNWWKNFHGWSMAWPSLAKAFSLTILIDPQHLHSHI